MSDNYQICKICKKFNKDIGKHVFHSHKMTSKKYYDEFYKKNNDGYCFICKKDTRFKSISNGYCMYCSDICSSMDDNKNKKISCTVSSNECQERTKNTCLKRYGTLYSFQSENNKRKSIQTNIKKYGNVHHMKSDIQKQKCRDTCFNRYGYDNPIQVDIFKNKIKDTCLRKYGYPSHLYDESIREYIKTYNLKKYGVEYKFQSDDFRSSAMYKGRYKLKDYKTIFGDNIKYQTKSEYNFIRYCESNGYRVLNGDKIPYEFDGKKRVYFCDFKIKENNRYRLVEIKKKHKWWYNELKSGKMLKKVKSAILFSKINNYLPYKIYFKF